MAEYDWMRVTVKLTVLPRQMACPATCFRHHVRPSVSSRSRGLLPLAADLFVSGRSVAWLARLFRVQEVVSSNLTAPTTS